MARKGIEDIDRREKGAYGLARRFGHGMMSTKLSRKGPGSEAGRVIVRRRSRGRATVGGNVCNAHPRRTAFCKIAAARSRDHRARGPARGACRRYRHRAGEDLARPGRDRRVLPAAQTPAALGRRVSALHPAHRDGHRRGRRRHQPCARRSRRMHRRACEYRRGRRARWFRKQPLPHRSKSRDAIKAWRRRSAAAADRRQRGTRCTG